ncbi:MAG: ABC transporter permease subunit [Rhodobacteraceae bacterium]|nr:ABC transporter permease subunit [Paracoccaceae bacterium]
MAVVTDEPKAGFRLGMLIYDTRYRSITIQIVVLILVMAGVAWLVDNLLRNLAVLGRGIDFSFLGNRSGYDINQTLVEYTNDSTHARATLVGLLNTLLVAFLGCVAATVVGVLAGVMRLSKNWVIARLMTVYVEVFRNIPLLLWILIIFAVFTEALPAPNAFRGENPAASMVLFDTVAFTNRYTAIPWLIFDNSMGWLTLGPVYLNIDLVLIVTAVVGGVFANRAILRRAKRIQEATGERPTTWWQPILALFGPIIAVFLFLGTHVDAPTLQGFNFTGGLQVSNSLVALWLALTLYTAAFIAEIVRAGINAVSRGQSEAAFALGLRPGRTMSLVILPQALRVIIPPLISQYLNLTKNSSLAIAVGYMDLRGTLGGITLNQTGRGLEAMMLLMLIYLVISLIISGTMNIYNNSVRLKER